MDSDRWNKIKEVSGTAMELEGDARIEYVADACLDDDDLRRQVDRILSEFDPADSFLEPPPLAQTTARSFDVADTVIPKNPTPSTDGKTESRLPPDLIERTARRLRTIGWFYTAAYIINYVIYEITAHVIGNRPYDQSVHTPGQVLVLGFSVISLSVSVAVRRIDLGARALVNLGVAFEIVGGLGVALAMHSGPPPHGTEHWVWGVSWLCVWVMAYPIFIPMSPRKAAAASFATAAMGLLALWIWVTAGAMEWPNTETILRMNVPNFVCAAFAWLGASTVFGLGVDLGKARRLGSYQLQSLLGRGGMGEVWIAEHHMLARPAALKLVRPEVLGGRDGKTALARFHIEARTTAALTSPHTVNLYDYGVTDDGTFYYVMELLDGLDLDTLVRRFGSVPPERAVHFLTQCCRSLGEAHGRGLIHRDVKPANIFVCTQGRELDFAKVLDFGLVKTTKHHKTATREATDDTAEWRILGTPGYMAPELALGAAPEPRADLYSLGCVGYWLLTGGMAFDGRSPLELVTEHVRTPPKPPSHHTDQTIPAELDALLLSCLSKDPSRRPESADAMVERLRGISTDQEWTQDRARQWWSTNAPSNASH